MDAGTRCALRHARIDRECVAEDDDEEQDEGVAFVQSESHGHANGVYDDTNYETDNGSEPPAKYDKVAPTAYADDVAKDKVGEAEVHEQEPEDEGVAFVQPGSHPHTKRVYEDTDVDTENAPEPSAKDDKDDPTAYELDVAVDREVVAEEDDQEQVDEGVAFVRSVTHGHAKGVYDYTNDETDNGSEPLAKYDKVAPTAYAVDVAVDKEGDAEEDEQEQQDEGVAFVQSGSHDHAKRVYEDANVDTDNVPEPSAKDDKDAPTAYEVDIAVDREGVAEEDKQKQVDEGVAFVQSGWHGHAKGVYDYNNDGTDNGPEPSAKYDKVATTAYAVDVAVDREGDAEEDAQEQEDEGVAFVHPGSHGRASRVYEDTDDVTDNAPESSAKNDKDAPTVYEVDVAVDREGVAEEDEQEEVDKGVAFVQSGSHGQDKGVDDYTNHETPYGPEPSANHDKAAPAPYADDVAVDKEGDAEEDEQEQEDEVEAFVQTRTHGHAKGVFNETDDVTDNSPQPSDAEEDEQEEEDEGALCIVCVQSCEDFQIAGEMCVTDVTKRCTRSTLEVLSSLLRSCRKCSCAIC